MMKTIFFSLIFITMLLCQCQTEQRHDHRFLQLWYRQPAKVWTEALPVGNGRLGAMVFGQTDTAVVQLNEESIWAGMPLNNNNPKALESLPKIRELLFDEKNREALQLAQQTILGTPPRIRSYQTLGDLFIVFKDSASNISNYIRSLDLSTGIVSVTYEKNGQNYRQQYFVSAPDNVIIVRLETDDPEGIYGSIFLKRSQDAVVKATGDHAITMVGQIVDKPDPLSGPGGEHMRFEGKLEVRNEDGTVTAAADHLEMNGVKSATLILTAATDYNLDLLSFDRDINPWEICDRYSAKNRA